MTEKGVFRLFASSSTFAAGHPKVGRSEKKEMPLN
jgi:hypothetical protein